MYRYPPCCCLTPAWAAGVAPRSGRRRPSSPVVDEQLRDTHARAYTPTHAHHTTTPVRAHTLRHSRMHKHPADADAARVLAPARTRTRTRTHLAGVGVRGVRGSSSVGAVFHSIPERNSGLL